MLKSDRWIREMVTKHKMIEPFVDHQVRDGNISYGLSSYGYDMRLADEFKIYEPKGESGFDPKNFDRGLFRDFKGTTCEIPPNSFVLGRSVEYFRIPRKVTALCFGKSTYARCGVLVNVTPLEAEWEGFVTIEIANLGPRHVKLHANEGISQVIFLESDEECSTSYKDKKGVYQAQKEITPSKVMNKQ
ncbi:MAG TPA: dCTP deaminase [Hadesarchaea archaeon]|nr:dCTP deaminase [Hadesarchaea archaeon]